VVNVYYGVLATLLILYGLLLWELVRPRDLNELTTTWIDDLHRRDQPRYIDLQTGDAVYPYDERQTLEEEIAVRGAYRHYRPADHGETPC
jgi:hypothetical protein